MLDTHPHFPPGFDKTVAQDCAKLVIEAYAQFNDFLHGKLWKIPDDYEELARIWATPPGVIQRKEPFGFVARQRTSRVVFVTFRGTQSLEDWLSNLTFYQIPHDAGAEWGQVETGFNLLYQQCTVSVVQGVKAAGAAPRVIVTGHSLGGALATLATADLTINGIAAEMYSMAAPRTGDPAFAAKFNSTVNAAWRLANTEDIVTTVPLATPKLMMGAVPLGLFSAMLALANRLDFQHVGVPVSFTAHLGSITANHDMGVYSRFI